MDLLNTNYDDISNVQSDIEKKIVEFNTTFVNQYV